MKRDREPHPTAGAPFVDALGRQRTDDSGDEAAYKECCADRRRERAGGRSAKASRSGEMKGNDDSENGARCRDERGEWWEGGERDTDSSACDEADGGDRGDRAHGRALLQTASQGGGTRKHESTKTRNPLYLIGFSCFPVFRGFVVIRNVAKNLP